MECAFFRLEVEIMILRNLEYIADCCCMSIYVHLCCDAYVIHIYSDGGSFEFVFHDDVPKDVVHHGLECCWGVCESKIHDCWFKKSISCFKSCLLFIALLYLYIVIPPSNVQFGIDMGIAEIMYKIGNQGEWVLVTYCYGIYFSIVLYQSQLSIFLLDVEEWGCIG